MRKSTFLILFSFLSFIYESLSQRTNAPFQTKDNSIDIKSIEITDNETIVKISINRKFDSFTFTKLTGLYYSKKNTTNCVLVDKIYLSKNLPNRREEINLNDNRSIKYGDVFYLYFPKLPKDIFNVNFYMKYSGPTLQVGGSTIGLDVLSDAGIYTKESCYNCFWDIELKSIKNNSDLSFRPISLDSGIIKILFPHINFDELIKNGYRIRFYDRYKKKTFFLTADFYKIFKVDIIGKYESGFIKDFYLNGDLKAEYQRAIYIDSIDDNKSQYLGSFTEYDRLGNVNLWGYKGSVGIDISNVLDIQNYFDNNYLGEIDGIWEYQDAAGRNVKLAIFKVDDRFQGFALKSNAGYIKFGDLQASLLPTANSLIYTLNWRTRTEPTIYGGVAVTVKTIATVSPDNTIINFSLPYPVQGYEQILYKTYPLSNKIKGIPVKNNEWAGNGSGIIISKSGHIVTNYHVIEDADDIEVEFILNDEVQKFNAEIVQVDKVNDLAIIKIFDMNFDGVDELPYNFKTRSSDVGTKVYAFGYPLALSLMGKEIKVTDGIISSKSGFDGDITTYQITAPIQGGNSGGPLFDEKGNLLGINSSKIIKDNVDNVAYTIKSNYVLNLIDVLPKSIELPSSTKLESLPLTEQIKEISKYVVLVKVK